MRFLSRSAHENRPPAKSGRRRPFPSTKIALGFGIAAIIAGGAGGYQLWHDGTVARIGGAIETHLFAFSAQHGMVLQNIEVVGRRRQSVASILAAIHGRRGMSIFNIDLGAIETRLEALPWIRTASVERQLPDTLYIRLVERQPFAFWQHNDRLLLIDRDGTVIPTDHIAPYGPLVVLVGDDAAAHAGHLIDMLATEPALAPRVSAAVRYGRRRWTLHFDNGITVALPETDALAAWRHLARMEAHDHILERNVVTIDLRLPDRVVLRLATSPAVGHAAARNKRS